MLSKTKSSTGLKRGRPDNGGGKSLAWSQVKAAKMLRALVKSNGTKNEKRLHELKQERLKLAKVLEGLVGRTSLQRGMSIKRELDRIDTEVGRLESNAWLAPLVEQVRPMVAEQKATPQVQALFNTHFLKDTSVAQMIDPESCELCKCPLVTLSCESLLVCLKCGRSTKLVYCHADIRSNVNNGNNRYDRSPLYRRFLMQFHEDCEGFPAEIMQQIHNQLAKTHTSLSGKVRPTPVSSILRRLGLQKYMSQVYRITKIMNNEPVAVMSSELIGRLVHRFEAIVGVYNTVKSHSRKKILNFEFLTKKFLTMEGRPDLAKTFLYHKTRSVLLHADRDLQLCCEILNKKGSAEQWVMVPSL